MKSDLHELQDCKTTASAVKVNEQFLRKLVREKRIPLSIVCAHAAIRFR
jgi:hypothetical protein